MPPPAFGWPVLMDWDGWIDMLRYLAGMDFPPFFFLLSPLVFLSCNLSLCTLVSFSLARINTPASAVVVGLVLCH